MSSKHNEGYIQTAEVAKRLHLSRTTIYNYIEKGLIKPSKRVVTLSGYTRYLFRESDIDAILQIMEEYNDEETDERVSYAV